MVSFLSWLALFFASISRNILFIHSYFIYTLYLYFLYVQYLDSYLYTLHHPIYSNHPRLDVIVLLIVFSNIVKWRSAKHMGSVFESGSVNVNETLTKGDFVRARLFQKLILKSL